MDCVAAKYVRHQYIFPVGSNSFTQVQTEERLRLTNINYYLQRYCEYQQSTQTWVNLKKKILKCTKGWQLNWKRPSGVAKGVYCFEAIVGFKQVRMLHAVLKPLSKFCHIEGRQWYAFLTHCIWSSPTFITEKPRVKQTNKQDVVAWLKFGLFAQLFMLQDLAFYMHLRKRSLQSANLKRVSEWHMFQNGTQHIMHGPNQTWQTKCGEFRPWTVVSLEDHASAFLHCYIHWLLNIVPGTSASRRSWQF